jgi:hypothetical protein
MPEARAKPAGFWRFCGARRGVFRESRLFFSTPASSSVYNCVRAKDQAVTFYPRDLIT